MGKRRTFIDFNMYEVPLETPVIYFISVIIISATFKYIVHPMESLCGFYIFVKNNKQTS